MNCRAVIKDEVNRLKRVEVQSYRTEVDFIFSGVLVREMQPDSRGKEHWGISSLSHKVSLNIDRVCCI